MYSPKFLASRRAFVRTVAAAPILASLAVEDLIASVRGSKENVYTRIGVRPLINARGTWTYLSGSLVIRGSDSGIHWRVGAARASICSASCTTSGLPNSSSTAARIFTGEASHTGDRRILSYRARP